MVVQNTFQSNQHHYSIVDKEWVENKRGIIGKNGELITLEVLGQQIAKFREDVAKAKLNPKPTKAADFVEDAIKEIEFFAATTSPTPKKTRRAFPKV